MDIEHPTEPTYWIATAGVAPIAGVTEPEQVTTFGPGWTLLLQTTDEAAWQAECDRQGLTEESDPTE
jgi:hypothetical protein